MENVRKAARRVLLPVIRLIAWFVRKVDAQKDPWERKAATFDETRARRFFGAGCDRRWRSYFEGESSVSVDSLRDICDWLAGCEYVSDQELFGKKDYWQHPIEFEKLRKGDCEDHALWAWRKLFELGYEAQLVCGTMLDGDGEGGHAWVLYRKEGVAYLFETTRKDPRDMVWPVEEVKNEYTPQCSVNYEFEFGYYKGLMEWQFRRFGV